MVFWGIGDAAMVLIYMVMWRGCWCCGDDGASMRTVKFR